MEMVDVNESYGHDLAVAADMMFAGEPLDLANILRGLLIDQRLDVVVPTTITVLGRLMARTRPRVWRDSATTASITASVVMRQVWKADDEAVRRAGQLLTLVLDGHTADETNVEKTHYDLVLLTQLGMTKPEQSRYDLMLLTQLTLGVAGTLVAVAEGISAGESIQAVL